MKIKTTKKSIMNQRKRVIKIGYCGLQTLLNLSESFAYTSGANGWNCDLYNFDNLIISTGYSPFGESVDYALVNEYEKKAQLIRYNHELSLDDMKKQLNELLNEFLGVI